MQLQPEDLTTPDYTLLESFGHDDVALFVRNYLKKPTFASIFYYALNFLIFGITLFLFARLCVAKQISVGRGMAHLSWGFGLFFLLIPIHELIHGLAYKSQGAKHTSYDMNLKKFYFLAVADKFVASKTEFRIVALAPFIVITLALGTALFFVSQLQMLAVLAALFMHTSACGGDFALMSFYDAHPDKTILTYDDKARHISYFYEKQD